MPKHSAVTPVPKLENDFYDWYERHAAKTAAVAADRYELIFIGDSITHLFAGHPGFTDRGDAVWQRYYSHRRALNLGYGWDRTGNVLWRLEHGEFAGQTPKLVVLCIGTNNLATTANYTGNTPDEIAEGVEAVCHTIKALSPSTAILLMGLFPRSRRGDALWNGVVEVNRRLAACAARAGYEYCEPGAAFFGTDGEIRLELMPDLCHPSAAGYEIWAAAIEPVVARHFPPQVAAE